MSEEDEPRQPPPPEPPPERPAPAVTPADQPTPFGEPRSSYEAFGEGDIPLPNEAPPPRARARDAQKNLDLGLSRIKREKRFGLISTIIGALFIAFGLAPVTWVMVYRFVEAPVTTFMISRAADGAAIRHTPVPLDRISPHLVRAVIAAEDARFCTHDGFDVEAIQNAMEHNARGGRTRGASTVSQQTAKNLFLWEESSWIRKGFEVYFTSLVEFLWPKKRIMEAYLNAAEWGDGVFGAEAAAQARFGVSAKDLTPLQAARLAAVLPSPNRWRADNPGPYVRRRSAAIVQRARVVQTERLASCVLAQDAPRAR